MSPAHASFQLFPFDGVVAPAVAVFVFVIAVGGVVLYGLQAARRRDLMRAAGALGLNEAGARFVGRALIAAPGSPAVLVSSRESLRAALAKRLGDMRDEDVAAHFASDAGWCMSQLGFLDAPFTGAPRVFDAVHVRDRSAAGFTAWVADVDETSLTLVTAHACTFAPHTPLIVTLDDGRTIDAELELKPVTAAPEWVLSHTLDTDVERRAMPRTACDAKSVILTPCGDVVETRRTLRLGRPLTRAELEGNEAWATRKRVRITDISSDGVALLTDDHAVPGETYHLLLTDDDAETVVGVPEFEIVRATRDPSGQLRIGARFMRLRLDERTAIAEWATRHATDAEPARDGEGLVSAAD